jgi:hypothetical protein
MKRFVGGGAGRYKLQNHTVIRDGAVVSTLLKTIRL